MMQDKKGLSIFLQLALSYLGVVIIISSVLTAVFYSYQKRSLEKHMTENILQQFEAIGYHLRFDMQEQLLNDLRILASNPSVDAYLMSSEFEKEINARAVERLFMGSLKYVRSYDRVYFVDSRGKESIKVDRTGSIKHYRNISSSALFANIKSGPPGGIHFVVPRRAADGRVAFSIGLNKTDPDIGKFGGAVIIDYNLEKFLEYLSNIRIFDENPLWLFGPNGRVLKQPNNGPAYFDPRPYFTENIQAKPRLLNPGDGLLVYRDFLILPEKPLVRLAISIPSSLLLGDVRSVLRFFIIVFLLSLLVISLIAYFLAGYLSKPITELSYAASHLAKGDLTTRVRVKSTGEVRMLLESFNRMAGELEKTTVSRNYVDDILGSMRDTLIVASPNGTITRVNMAACFLLGYDEAELVGQPIDRVIADDPGAGAPTLTMALQNGFVSTIEKTYLAKNGEKVPVLFSASVMRDVRGDIQGIVCAAHDITDRKRDEEKLKVYSEELQEINEELKNFAYIVSHDLRAPLVNIKGFSEELKRALHEIGPFIQKHLSLTDQVEREKVDPVLQKDIPEALTFIGSSVNRMDNLINAVLKLSRAGRRKLTPEPIIIRDLVRTVVDSLTHQIESHKITVTVGELPDLVADRTAVEQIFGNLLDNAIKYLDPGRPGAIAVSAERNGTKTVFHIQDNGRGMAKEDIPRAFEIFRRVGRQDVPGEGMGLANVKMLVRLLGGRIWCVSEPGQGTTFSFSLPVPAGNSGEQAPTGGRS